MLGFALAGFTSFSLKPLRLSVLLGLLFALLVFIYGIYAILMKSFTGQANPGWSSVLVCVLFIGGIQLMVLGIIGESIGKLFMESKQRPHYILKKKSEIAQRQGMKPRGDQTNSNDQKPKFKTRENLSRQIYYRGNTKTRKTEDPERKSSNSNVSHKSTQRVFAAGDTPWHGGPIN